MDSWLCTCCNVWHELGSLKKLKQQLVEGKGFAAWRLQKPLLLLLLQQPVLTFLLCLPWKLGWSWRCRVLCIPRTSSDTRWAHREHERCRGALASFISAVKNCLWKHDYCFYHFNSRMVWLWRPFVWRCHSEVRFSSLRTKESYGTAREWSSGRQEPSQHGQSPEGFGQEGWVWDSLLGPCYTSVKAWLWCAENKTWAASKGCVGVTTREIPAQQEGQRGADHLKREE